MGIDIDLSADIAVVTGGGSGIGHTTAITLSQAGAAVAVADLDLDSASDTAGVITSAGGSAMAVRVDVADLDSVRSGAEEVRRNLGRPSILVNNAGAWVTKLFVDTEPEEVRRIIDVGLVGTINVTRELMADLEGHGRIVNVVSEAALIGARMMSIYGATKAALVGLTRSVAEEAGRNGVRVNAVAPGVTDTPGAADFIELAGGPEKLARANPLGRIGDPQDVANAVVFLVSPLAGWITGQTLAVNGGTVAH
ncbi:MAG: SDR family NAD(P)-dependent oxidoreductase [Microthrixaceae bacterium]